eukprot:jgi/Mesen1/6074/ME000031S05345
MDVQYTERLRKDYNCCQAINPHRHADALEVRSKEIVAAKSHTELQAPGRLHKVSSKKARTSTSILDLPVGILERILQSACVDTERTQTDGQIKGISKNTVECITRVCTRWRDLVRSSCKIARCDSLTEPDVALSQLETLRNVTHVQVSRFLEYEHLGFLRKLATGFPLLTFFDLSFRGSQKDLEVLSLFLSLKTDIQELTLYTAKFVPDPGNWNLYRGTLESLDFTPQVHLKKLTLSVRYDPLPRFTGGFCIPVSTTLTQLAGLEELHITVDEFAEEAYLPPWLAELPAFVGLRSVNMNGAPCSSFINSLARMTSLEELFLTGVTFNASEMGAVSKLSHLTSLIIEESKFAASMAPFCPTTTLRELSCPGEVLPLLGTTLSLLEELTVMDMSLVKTSKPTYFARTPNIRSLTLLIREERGAGPPLEHLTGLTSLCLDETFEYYDAESPSGTYARHRRPSPKALLPCFTCLIFRDHNRGGNSAEEDNNYGRDAAEKDNDLEDDKAED